MSIIFDERFDRFPDDPEPSPELKERILEQARIEPQDSPTETSEPDNQTEAEASARQLVADAYRQREVDEMTNLSLFVDVPRNITFLG